MSRIRDPSVCHSTSLGLCWLSAASKPLGSRILNLLIIELLLVFLKHLVRKKGIFEWEIEGDCQTKYPISQQNFCFLNHIPRNYI